jgi:hypothetical protein
VIDVAADLAALNEIATEHGLPVHEVLWTAIARTTECKTDRASVDKFYRICRREDPTTPAFSEFRKWLQALCETVGLRVGGKARGGVRTDGRLYVHKPKRAL